ncbi:SnoaL-like domain protein [Hartmannibacter diazotrophicus]|uniref:SnoaL-like domain protein n=1 Tax=Hartmannibacter diazotrophicus TaxID=1482074 RepID=A0A2C9D3G8_9HYPH|nr:SgcJ/EcaC family oxidoreductase [Hartmannibacter diazotrophicus]SON54015.1 SnoaL-like domain protein [Hartmannibacter diazotrophicus]
MTERYGNADQLRSIDKIRDDHVMALNSGDADAWVAQFADDGVQMPPNAPENVGKTQIGQWSAGFLSTFKVQFELDVDEVRVIGDWAFERGDYVIGLNPVAGGPSMGERGKYITIYHYGDRNGWRIARDIWNSNNPLSA